MEITLGQQYNVGEKPTVILYTYIHDHAGTPEKHFVVVSHIQRISCNPKKTILYTVANPARGLLNREGKKKESGSPPLPPRAARSEKKKKKITRRIHMSKRYASWRYAAGQVVSVRLASVQGFLRLVG